MIAYLDNSSTTKTSKDVVDAMINTMNENYGNPSSLHNMGIMAENAIKTARSQVAKALSVNSKNICFTASGSESNNLAILGTASLFRTKGEIITTRAEHKSVLECFARLEKLGFIVHYLDVAENGQINLEKLESLVNESTQLVSIMHVNNETGAIAPIEKISKIINKKNPKALFHTDAVQSFCKIEIPKNCAHLISVSAHKIHGPKGIGALYIADNVKISPIIFGGGQENNLRSGTENTPAIVGFGVAVNKFDTLHNYESVRILVSIMENKLLNEVEDIHINSPHHGLPYILNISATGVPSEILLHSLEQKGVYVSSGSACSSRSNNSKSYVLSAMGLNNNKLQSSIRISFSPENTKEQVIYASNAIIEEIKNIRKVTSQK